MTNLSTIFTAVIQNCGKGNTTEKIPFIVLQGYMKQGYKNPTKQNLLPRKRPHN